MADKHTLTLTVLHEYGVDLTVPHETEFDIVSCAPIEAAILAAFAAEYGFGYEVSEIGDDCYLATLTKRLVLSEQVIRPISELVESFCKRHGWEYNGWGASSWK